MKRTLLPYELLLIIEYLTIFLMLYQMTSSVANRNANIFMMLQIMYVSHLLLTFLLLLLKHCL